MRVIGRLKRAVTLDAAQSDMTTIAEVLAGEFPATNKRRGVPSHWSVRSPSSVPGPSSLVLCGPRTLADHRTDQGPRTKLVSPRPRCVE